MKLLIADDEMQIRTGLAEGIAWEQLGIDAVFTAENGIEAYEIAQEEQPEIILTDIRMPGMDGLELGKKISALYQPVEVIILSGYNEFEYARAAIQIGAFDYLLKPIHIKALMDLVQKATAEIAKKRQSDANSTLAEMMRRRERLKTWTFSGQRLSAEVCREFCKTGEIETTGKITACLCISDGIEERNREQFGVYLDSLLEKSTEQVYGKMLFQDHDQIFCVVRTVMQEEREQVKQQIMRILSDQNRLLQNQFGVTATCTMSRAADAADIPLLYADCRNLLRHRLYRGKGQLICAEEVSEEEILASDPVDAEEIQPHIAEFDYAFMHWYIGDLFGKLAQRKVTSTDLVKGICLNLKNILITVVSERGLDVRNVLEENEILLNDIPDYCALEDYQNWIDNLYYLILQGMGQIVGKQHSRAIVQAMEYISRHYAENINLEMTAEYVRKSKNYFSYLFKKEAGVSFVEYLNGIRVKEAKKLLDTTDQMTYEISEKVGFNDYKYFSGIFKKQTGMSPAQYRKRNQEASS